jgi:hypothetical protein
MLEGEQIYTVSVITFRLLWHQKMFDLPGVLPLGRRVPLIYHPRKDSVQVGQLPALFKLFCLLLCGCALIIFTILGFRLFNLTEMDRNFWGWSATFFKEITSFLPRA